SPSCAGCRGGSAPTPARRWNGRWLRQRAPRSGRLQEPPRVTREIDAVGGLIFDCRHRYPAGFELEARFEAGAGVTALFGPSGSGKSTVLSIIAGMRRPDAGTVRLGDRVLFDAARGICLPPEKRGIGFVFQDLLLFPHLTVEANLRFGARRRPTRAIPFERVVEVLELGALLRRHPHTLSGGERQRTALGRAILRGPELLLLDEPLTALDEGL